ncbi:unnamed protein product [Rotaria sp. Silwood2]|nr:unnamed protein product [Rotaria sp. Silwood2]
MSKSSSKSSSAKSIVKTVDLNSRTTSSSTSNLYKDILELVLLCTLTEEPSTSSLSKIYLTELASLDIKNWDKNRIDQALFERLRICDPSSQLITSSTKRSSIAHEIISENRCLHYLSGCYQRLLRQRDHFQLILDDIQKLFIDHSKTAITLPSMYDNQDLSKQWIELLIESNGKKNLHIFFMKKNLRIYLDNALLCEYIDFVNNELLSSMTTEIESLYEKVFHYMYKAIQPLDYFSNDVISYISVLTHLSQWAILVQMIFRLSHPKTLSNRSSRDAHISSTSGRAFQDTLIGSLLSKSCLPSIPGKPFLFFNKPKLMSERDIEITATTMWQPMKTYQDHLSQLFKVFVKSSDARHNVLKWIGDCFDENQGKNKEWSSHDPLAAFLFVSDGFLLNLNVVLLNLAKPFAEPYSSRLLKINPLYAISRNENVHLKELYKETPLINRTDEIEDEKNRQITFNFITEIFFMSHFSYSISVHRLHRILIGEELTRIREAYNNAVKLDGPNHENSVQLGETMENGLTAFLNIKTMLNEPYLLELLNALFTSTCSWLVHIASSSFDYNQKSDGEEQMNILKKLPLTSEPNRQLSYIPEFIMENIIDYLKFLGRYNTQVFQSIGSSINEYVNLILVFMGDMNRLRNPHLRATLAEALEIILPNEHEKTNRIINNLYTETMFQEYPLIEHLPCALLDVFVSIELTGQAVAFEQKFSYRRPMYDILEYLWKFDKHREPIKKLASYAERHIDDAEAPLFLRFINLLMNDANFLLDEALTYMARLRADQEAKEHGEWNEKPEKQRQELENAFQHTGRIARYMNIMGIKTYFERPLLAYPPLNLLVYIVLGFNILRWKCCPKLCRNRVEVEDHRSKSKGIIGVFKMIPENEYKGTDQWNAFENAATRSDVFSIMEENKKVDVLTMDTIHSTKITDTAESDVRKFNSNVEQRISYLDEEISTIKSIVNDNKKNIQMIHRQLTNQVQQVTNESDLFFFLVSITKLGLCIQINESLQLIMNAMEQSKNK